MKKLLITLVTTFFILNSYGQEYGKWWLGGEFGFHYLDSKNSKDSDGSFKILPEVGIVINENISVGLSIGFIQDNTWHRLSDNIAEQLIGAKEVFRVAPFVRYSFLKGKLGNLFTDFSVGYERGDLKDLNIKVSQFDAGVRPGVAIILTDRIVLTGKLGFFGYTYMDVEEDYINSFGLDFTLNNCLFGVNILF